MKTLLLCSKFEILVSQTKDVALWVEVLKHGPRGGEHWHGVYLHSLCNTELVMKHAEWELSKSSSKKRLPVLRATTHSSLERERGGVPKFNPLLTGGTSGANSRNSYLELMIGPWARGISNLALRLLKRALYLANC